MGAAAEGQEIHALLTIVLERGFVNFPSNYYPWSGHAVIMGKAALEGQVADEVLSLFAKGKREATMRYRLFVADGVAFGKCDEFGSG